MNRSDREDEPEVEVESFLQQMDWAQPSAHLDRRIASLLRPRVVRGWGWAKAGLAGAATLFAVLWSMKQDPPRVVQQPTPTQVHPTAPTQLVSPRVTPAQPAGLGRSVRIERAYQNGLEEILPATGRGAPIRRVQGQVVRQVLFFDLERGRRMEVLIPEWQYARWRPELY